MNKRITPKERGLLKGAIRRVFSRSDLRRRIVDLTRIEHTDAARPRVKKWSLCPDCNKPTPTYLIQVDHHIPIIPLDSSLEEMTWDTVIDRTWCDENNLRPICTLCHTLKSSAERKERTLNKRKRSKK